jgi:hypothetical protein
MQSQLSNAVRFLAAPPMVLAEQQSAQSIPNSAYTGVTLDTPIYDNYQGFNNPADLAVYQVASGAAGIYLLTGRVALATSSTTAFLGALYSVNGTNIGHGDGVTSQPGISYLTPTVYDLVRLNASDIVRLATYQSTGAAINTFIGLSCPSLTLRWVATQAGTAGLSPPNPRTWALNDASTALMFNTEIRDAVRFLSYPPYCRAVQGTIQSIPNNTFTTFTNIAPGLDNYSAWSGSTWTCPVSGTYLCTAAAGIGSANVQMGLKTVISSVSNTYFGTSLQGPAGNGHAGMAKTLRLSAGDTIQPGLTQNSGAAANTVVAIASTRFCALWMSA